MNHDICCVMYITGRHRHKRRQWSLARSVSHLPRTQEKGRRMTRGREDVEKEVQEQEDEHEEKLYAEVSSYLLVLICPSPTLPSCSLACIFAAPLSRISVHHTPFDICTQLSFVKEGREHQYTTTGHHMRQYTHKCHILESRYNTANRCSRGYIMQS